jgi:hypothetical protein
MKDWQFYFALLLLLFLIIPTYEKFTENDAVTMKKEIELLKKYTIDNTNIINLILKKIGGIAVNQ